MARLGKCTGTLPATGLKHRQKRLEGMSQIDMSPHIPVGAAEGCDLLIFFV
jgi:hypothetical protein